jgi:hypothetical protein
MKPQVTLRPSGVSAQKMAEEICATQPEGLAVLDAESLAELFVAYHENVKRGEQDARAPKPAEPPPAPEAPVERCPECFLAFGEHRADCSRRGGLRDEIHELRELVTPEIKERINEYRENNERKSS